MVAIRTLLLSTLFACALEHEVPQTDPVLPPDPMDVSTDAIADMRCDGTPATGGTSSWRHLTSRYVAELGHPHHRGIDLIAVTTDATQTLRGRLTYSDLDKDLEDEDVELFACLDDRWQPIGDARTDDEGMFALALTGDERLPGGMRDVYVSVKGDRTGAEFVAFVAPVGTPVIVSDVDGTLTESENAYPMALALGGDVVVQADAPAAFASAVTRGVSVVYITARGDRFTQDTRDWFALKGFPRGPIRMPSSIITLPGDDTVEFKSDALAELASFTLLAGFGNRASDITAYTNAGLTHERILIKLPEFTEEIAGDLMAGLATGFEQYERARADILPPLMP